MANKTELIEIAMHIDPKTGVSNWWDIDELEQIVGFPLRGNGSALIQNDRGLGKKYLIEKQYEKGTRLSSVRTIGIASYHQVHKAEKIPSEVRKWIESGQPCAMCGTTANVVPDHKDGNRQPIEMPDKDDFQPLCRHCNTVKREICKKCNSSSIRFNARDLGFCISWTQGNGKFQPKLPRCQGCFWYSPREFRAKLILPSR